MTTNKTNEHDNTSDTQVKKKRAYQKMTITPIAVVPSGAILAGSVTNQAITVENVTVAEFTDDSSFPTDGFEVNFD